ncbi:MAG TPA: hypothetical protein VGV64_04490, partial [Thermoplasmata archaeon]|nr:hypothetical protein [Thermoplasmata archaeon]
KQSSWLRAVLGSTASGERTVTVWGKLSWGANPLAASSTQDGLADGARIDPLVHRYLQLSSLNAGLSSSCSGLSNGVGWEIHLFINDSTPSGHAEVQNYTNGSQVSGSGCGSLTGYTVSVPIDQTMQNQSLTAQFAYNDGSLKSLAVNGSSKSAIVHLDAFLNSASTGGHSYSGTGSGTSLSFTETTIRVAGKSPTWLWLPDGNGTLSPAPWGLKTYTGEQAFDLVTVNNQYGSTLSASVPNFWALSTTTPLSLPSGLNNLLIPRAQFLNSSLGHGLILGKGFQDSSSSTPPMLGTSELSAISTFSASNDLTGVGCYWQNRGISSSAGGLCSNEGTIPSDSSNLRVRVEGDGNWSSSNGGGMPLKPGALNTTSEGASLQAALTLNVSSTTELNLLLAGLIDNATGGVNGSFTAITYEVPLLGFAPAVVKAIANQPVTSDGLFGAPTYNPPPTPPQTSFWGSVWNTVSGIGNAVINGVSTVVAAAWTVATAALHYLSNAASALGQYAEQAIKTIVSGLVGLGNLLLKALQWALQAFLKLLKSALQAAFAPLQKILVSWALNVNQSLKDALTSGDISLATSQEMWSAISGTGYEIGMTLAYVVEAALAVAAVLSADSEELAMTAVSAFVGLALGMFMPAITAFITQSMVHTTENTANGTLNQHPQQTWWNVSAESFGWYAAGYTNIQAASDLYKDANNPGSGPAKVVTDAIGFAVGLEALLITVMSIATGIKSCALAIWGLILDVSSIVVDIIGMALPASGPTAASDAEDGLGLDDITLLIDTATFEIDLGQMATYGC